ncbi:retinal cone rhodopsin-sensitive cGMP 3',5'-cyclic phosphodiesterase subunit gamma-like protein [Lates japonicus]|uniref:3',5'-cyclic-GMP phosphodiesterase n=1 Tax=Lates japonicus TaxID=270547 RepID=A0AAD3RIS4_LATJO|nr:retinal cone rhodopsin-sensitive cGMP 3',5'-cyclic phosphodiesterase subunit gamma-like protein [Lates japonicus]
MDPFVLQFVVLLKHVQWASCPDDFEHYNTCLNNQLHSKCYDSFSLYLLPICVVFGTVVLTGNLLNLTAVVCPWEAFGDMELSDLAQFGIV